MKQFADVLIVIDLQNAVCTGVGNLYNLYNLYNLDDLLIKGK
ncbi:hypothetical protein [Rummeliibacillus suwonensis]|nr:hypothetical protein [Rummeliibacillus suwonensis]